MPVAALIGGAASLAGTALSQFGADSRAEQSYQRQKELAALQNQYAVENWARENRYNTPEEQRKRLQAAGLNPDLMYGSGGVGNQAGPIASPSAPSAPMAQTFDYSKSVNDAVQAAVGIAQAKKAGSETIAQTIENDYLKKTLVDRIEQVSLQNKWTKEQTKKTTEEISNLQQNYNLLVGQINALSTDRQIRDKELQHWDERFYKELRSMDDAHNLSHEEYVRLRDTYDDFIRTIRSGADKSEWDAKMSELMFNIESDYARTEKNLGMAGKLIGMLLKILK